MFVGHYGVALALKKADPRMSLGTLFLGVQLVDILWGLFIVLGWERVRVDPGFTAGTPFQFLYYPISHSLLAGVFWALVAAGLYYSRPTTDTSHRRRGSLILAVAVLSHWFLDAIVHVPDLPLAGDGSPKIGLGLWDNIGATNTVEFGLLAIGVWLYATSKTRRRPLRKGRLAALVVLLAALSAVNLWRPPPDNVTLIGSVAILTYLGLAWMAGWVDHDPPAEPAPGRHHHHHKPKAA